MAMQMTVDALLRSLRSLAHGVADRIEVKPVKRPATRPQVKERDDDQSRR